MATALNKTVLRESSVIVGDDRNIMVSLAEDQSIKMKLKGMKSGEVSIPIKTLYNQLTGNSDNEIQDSEPEIKSKSISRVAKEDKVAPMINLHELRSMIHVTPMDTTTLITFDKIILEILENKKRNGRNSY